MQLFLQRRRRTKRQVNCASYFMHVPNYSGRQYLGHVVHLRYEQLHINEV